jgi:hypothetical protein
MHRREEADHLSRLLRQPSGHFLHGIATEAGGRLAFISGIMACPRRRRPATPP